jgi:hypothetical protein
MQIIKLPYNHGERLHCPFCGEAIIDVEDAFDILSCPHTLFHATNDGFVYQADEFSEYCEAHDVDSNTDIERMLADTDLALVVCFHIESPPSIFLDMYIGFAVDLEEYEEE